MSKLVKDSTAQQMVEAIKGVERAIRGYEPEQKEWSITINQASNAFPLPNMGGDTTSWLIFKNKIGRYFVEFPDENGICKAHKLDKTDSSLLEDGTPVDTTNGNIMVRIPHFYFNVRTEGDIVTLTMSEREFGENCQVVKEQWIGAYFGWLDTEGKLRSLPDVNPTRSRQIRTFWADAQKNGEDFGLMDYNHYRYLIMLYLCEFLDKNSQACLGNGMTGTGDNWCAPVYNAVTGATAGLGDQCGKVMFNEPGQNVAGACHVSLFGIEDPYGWYWTMTQGMYFGNSENEEQEGNEAFAYEGNRMPTDEELHTEPTGVFRKLTRSVVSGWLQTIIAGPQFDVIPASVGNNRWGDYHWANSTGQLLLWGGSANGGSGYGLACSSSGSSFTDSGSDVGARLAFYGGHHKIDFVHQTKESDNNE